MSGKSEASSGRSAAPAATLECKMRGGHTRPLVLASRSPRRVELLRAAGFAFTIMAPDTEEAHDAALTPAALTLENARRKAVWAAGQRLEAWVIGADTLVYVDGRPLGKPRDYDEAATMLRLLSGRAHEVCTGVVIAGEGGAECHAFAVVTKVIFKPLTDAVIRDYHHRVNPLDKAGAYGIQECSDLILQEYSGSWTNVMGMPMERLVEELARLNGSATAHIQRRQNS